MSETKIKLNLKALKKIPEEEKSTTATSDSSIQKESQVQNQAQDSKDDKSIESASKTEIKEVKKEDKQPTLSEVSSKKKISLGSIKASKKEENEKKDIASDIKNADNHEFSENSWEKIVENSDTNINWVDKKVSEKILENESSNNLGENKHVSNSETSVKLQAETEPENAQELSKVDKNDITRNDKNIVVEEKISENLTLIEEVSTKEKKDHTKETIETKRNKKGGFNFFKRKKKNVPIVDTKKEDTTEVHFDNYTSSFENQSKNLLKHVQHFRYAPKTRKWLVLVLISITICITAGAVIIAPEKHNYNNYKASLLDIIFPKAEKTTLSLPQVNTELPSIEDKVEISEPEVIEPKQSEEEKRKEKIRNHILERYKSE